jgi:DNA-binding NarL/FixJ family response regulator
LVLFSFQTNETDNCEGLEELLTGCRGTRVLALVDNVDEDVLLKVVRCGASGYVLTNGDSDQLLTAVRQTLGGNNPLDREVAMRLLRRLVGEAGSEHMRSSTPGSGAKESAGEEKAVFTPRELVVLNGLVEGKTNRQIARNLHVSLSTVKRHVERILPKLGVSDRTQAAVRAVQLDLLPTRKD